MDRPKIILVGTGPRHRAIFDRLIQMDFADVELRALTHCVVGVRPDLCIYDALEAMPKDLRFPLLYGNPKPLKLRAYDWKPEPADGIIKRKEPKGPRGRWGKL